MPTFAEQMVSKYETLLLASAGRKTVSVDGITVTIEDLEAKHSHWKRILSREDGSRPTIGYVNLGG